VSLARTDSILVVIRIFVANMSINVQYFYVSIRVRVTAVLVEVSALRGF